jgi:topoisomerase IV subunit B
VDEAIAGHAKRIEVILHSDASVTVTDDGRGMPVDVHPGEKVTGVGDPDAPARRREVHHR